MKSIIPFVFCVFTSVLTASLFAGDSSELKKLREERKLLAEKPYRVIFNNDGCDALHYPKSLEISKENFLSLRTSGLKGTGVSSISYCPTSSGFGCFTQKTKAGTVLDKYYEGEELKKRNTVNATGPMIAAGYDPLDCILEFGKQEGLEVFWTFRMNDTHDVEHRTEKPYLLFPPLKERHPEWLFGKIGEKFPHGRWSSVDYSHKEITDLAFRFAEEVCRERDLTGIELDFCRHFSYFKSVATGGMASEEECEAITSLLRRIRAMTEKEGLRRGKPILITVRTVDDPDYCKAAGLDLERWMNEKLADVFVGSDYFRLRPWSDWVALGRKYGVPVYAGLSESRVREQDKRFQRNSTESYDARIAAIWDSGMDGLYVFNVYKAQTPFLKTCDSPEKLRRKNKLYFHTVRDGNANHFLKNGENYRKQRLITPHKPLLLGQGKSATETMVFAENAGDDVRAIAHCRFDKRPPADAFTLTCNGRTLSAGTPFEDEWLDVTIPLEAIKRGENRFAFDSKNGPVQLKDFVVEFQCK